MAVGQKHMEGTSSGVENKMVAREIAANVDPDSLELVYMVDNVSAAAGNAHLHFTSSERLSSTASGATGAALIGCTMGTGTNTVQGAIDGLQGIIASMGGGVNVYEQGFSNGGDLLTISEGTQVYVILTSLSDGNLALMLPHFYNRTTELIIKWADLGGYSITLQPNDDDAEIDNSAVLPVFTDDYGWVRLVPVWGYGADWSGWGIAGSSSSGSESTLEFRDGSLFNEDNCEPVNPVSSLMSASNTFEKRLHLNLTSSGITSVYGGYTNEIMIQCNCSGKLELEFIVCGSSTSLIQTAKIVSTVWSNAGNNSCTISNTQIIQYDEVLAPGATSIGPMQIMCYPGSATATDYPVFQVVDGTQTTEVLLVKARFLGLAPYVGADNDLQLIPGGSGGTLVNVPCIPRGAYVNSDGGGTMPPYVQTWASTFTGGGGGIQSVVLQPAANYVAGSMLYVKDAVGGMSSWPIVITTDGSDSIDNVTSSITFGNDRDCVALMSDGASNWMVMDALSTGLFYGSYSSAFPGCGGIEM